MRIIAQVWATLHAGVFFRVVGGQDIFLSTRTSSAPIPAPPPTEAFAECGKGDSVSAQWNDRSDGISRWHDCEIREIRGDGVKVMCKIFGKSQQRGRRVPWSFLKKGDKFCLQSSAPIPAPPPPPPGPPVFTPSCAWAAPGWPTFNNAHDLSSDSEWSNYFTQVYGGIPQDSTSYPICVGAFSQIAVRGGNPSNGAKQCSSVKEGDLVEKMSWCCDPPGNIAKFIHNTKNTAHIVPDNHWFEIQHSGIEEDGAAWYYLTFGSAIWFNAGKSKGYNDHPDASLDLLGLSTCTDNSDNDHQGSPTECEQDFPGIYAAAKTRGFQTLQFIHHYDCWCGQQGPSSQVGWNKLCLTEVIDLHANANKNVCRATYKAGWAATETCSCDASLQYTNCKGFGIGVR